MNIRTDEEYMNIWKQVEAFSRAWEQSQGYRPAPFQKAIAMQRLERGQSIQEIIDSLVSQRV